MHELALFAGGGGGLLSGTLLGWETVAAVEIDPFCREMLLRRQIDGVLSLFPIWDDARTFDGRPWRGMVDVVSAGFPCQPFSVAGKRLADSDERNLWPETARILGEVRPRFAFLENVPGLLAPYRDDRRQLRPAYMGTVLGSLAELGYAAEWCVLGAHHAGAPHERDRLWILAHAGGIGSSAGLAGSDSREEGNPRVAHHPSHQGRVSWWDRDPADVEEPSGEGSPERSGAGEVAVGGAAAGPERSGGGQDGDGHGHEERAAQSRLGRVAHGVAHRVDRIRAIGNGQVPAVAATAWRILIERAFGAQGG